MTTSLLSAEQLKQQIRLRLADRRLPAIAVGLFKTHRGTGRPCLVCRREIGPNETEYDVDGAGVVMIAHELCYTLWREESMLHHPENRPADELLAQLRGSRTDLGRFVEIMLRHHLPHLVVPANAVRAWQEREPQTWAMVRDWLAEQGKSVRLV